MTLPLVERLEAHAALHDRMMGSVRTSGLCREAAAEIERLRAVADKRVRALHFLASVIKSGESWTQACEAEYREALKP